MNDNLFRYVVVSTGGITLGPYETYGEADTNRTDYFGGGGNIRCVSKKSLEKILRQKEEEAKRRSRTQERIEEESRGNYRI